MTQHIYDVGQTIPEREETDKSQEWEQAVGKPRDTERAWKTKRLSQSTVKGQVKITLKQMWFDLTAIGTHLNRELTCCTDLGWPTESHKTQTTVQTCPICPYLPPLKPASSSGGLVVTVLFRECGSHALGIA